MIERRTMSIVSLILLVVIAIGAGAGEVIAQAPFFGALLALGSLFALLMWLGRPPKDLTMSQLSRLLRDATDSAGERDYLTFCCPGCRAYFSAFGRGLHMMERHQVIVRGPGAWGYNGNPNTPTFTPSVLMSTWYWDEATQTKIPYTCHSFVESGRINFLGDCTHELRGWHDLAEWPDWQERMAEESPKD